MSLSYAELSRRMNALVTSRDREWCGVPMPLPGVSLVVEDRHPLRAMIDELQRIINPPSPEGVRVCHADDVDRVIVNQFHATRRHSEVIIVRNTRTGRTTWGEIPHVTKRNKLIWGPFEAIDAWDIDVECTAIDTLASMINERMFKSYLLTGAFLETSKRSGVHYLFRRLRPTVAMSAGRAGYFRGRDAELRVLCALCLHPLAYYESSFCGAMVPTDDVIAHLTMMRADEAMFWRRANQHPAWAPESGL